MQFLIRNLKKNFLIKSSLKYCFNDNSFKIGLFLLLFLILMSFSSMFIDVEKFANIQNLENRLISFGDEKHILGTDHLGRDIFFRIVEGASISLKVGFTASLISLLIGITIGILSGYCGSIFDMIFMRITDMMMAFPTLLFVIAISITFQPGIKLTIFSIGIVSWPHMARLIRSQVLMIKNQDYVQSAIALGYSNIRIIVKHILPNCVGPIIIIYSLGISSAIMSEAGLSFLGLGLPPSMPSWGTMINEGKDFLRIAPGLSLFPGLFLMISVLAFNLIGEGLRDALDFRIRK